MIKNYLFKIIVLLLCTTSVWGQSTWQYLPDAPMDGGKRIDDVFFINETAGWCATSFGSIHHTKDGGLTWEKQFQGGWGYYFRCIEFRDSLLGFAGTLNKNLLRTVDGGQTWTDVAADIQPIPDAICGVSIADDSTVYAVGQWDSPAFLLQSQDEGQTWTSKDMTAYANALVDILFLSRDTGFVSGKSNTGGVILYTTDGGQTWTQKFNTMISGEYIWKLQQVTPEVWVASVQTWSAGGRMIKSLDGGATWQAIPAPLADMQGIGFATPDHGWVGGYFPGFYETLDGGQTWNFQSFGSNYNRFYFLSPTLGFASGASIFKFSPDTITGIKNIFQPAPDPFSFSLSPNPASGTVTVSFDLPRADIVRISVATLAGAEVRLLFNERLEAGHHDIPVATGNLAAGAWLVCFQRNVGLYSQRLMVR